MHHVSLIACQTASELSFRALLFARGICSAAASVPGEEVTDQKGEAGHFRPSLAGSNVASFCLPTSAELREEESLPSAKMKSGPPHPEAALILDESGEGIF